MKLHASTMSAFVFALLASQAGAVAAGPDLGQETAQSSPARTTGKRPFPLPTAALVLPDTADDGQLDVFDLMQAFEKATGQTLVHDASIVGIAKMASIPIPGGTVVPPGEIYSLFESILFYNGFVLEKLKGGVVPLIGVHALSTHRGGVLHFVEVGEGELEAYRDHPALLVRTVIDMGPTDARQVATSMRGLMADSRIQALVATHTGLVVAGPGRAVAELTSVLKLLRSQAVEREKRLEDRSAAEQGKGGGNGEDD